MALRDGVSVSFELTRGEFIRASRLVMRHESEVWIAFAAIVGVVALTALLDMFVFGLIGAVVAVAVQLVVVPRRLWKNNAPALGSQQLHASDAGLDMSSPAGEGHVEWAVYKRAVDAGEFYLLRMRAVKASNFVPKRAFASRDDERRFRAIVMRHLPTNWSTP